MPSFLKGFKVKNPSKQPHKPSKQPSKQQPESNDDSLVDSLHAFRTITAMLNLFETRRRDTLDDESILRSNEGKEELKLLDALAAITVRLHEIVGVTAKSYDGSGNIQVLASVWFDQPPTDNSSVLPSRMSGVWNLLIGQNPRIPPPSQRKPSESTSVMTENGPIVVDPGAKVPEHLKVHAGSGQGLLEAYLIHEWPGLAVNLETSFYTHIWMITKLLGYLKSDLPLLPLYVTATCYGKMLTRLNYRTWQLLFAALTDQQNIEFSEQSHVCTPGELASDNTFLSKLPQLQTHLGASITNLIQVSRTENLYTAETCMDFHRILCELLSLFHTHLQELAAFQGQQGKAEEVHQKLVLVTQIGNVLRLMSKGAAIKKHLKLVARYIPDKVVQLTERGEVTADNNYMLEQEELMGLHTGQPSTQARLPAPKWKICNNWLELIIIYYDAIQIVSRFVTTHSIDDVDIKIITQSPPDQKMLTWRELLRCKSYFPSHPNPSLSSSELIKFLEFKPKSGTGKDNTRKDNTRKDITRKGNTRKNGSSKDGAKSSVENVIEMVVALGELDDQVAFTLAHADIMERICCLTNCGSPGSASYLESIRTNLKSLPKSDQRSEEIAVIVQMLKTLRASAKVFDLLKEGTALSTGRDFLGTYHCEACPAAFCLMTPEWRRENGKTPIGVSKRCCPVCAHLLQAMDHQFVFTAAHRTTTSCALPEWLPAKYIKDVTLSFGNRLRQELVELKKSTEILQSCDRSIGSANLSTDTVHFLDPFPDPDHS